MSLLGNRQHDAQNEANRHTCRTLLNCYIREFGQASRFFVTPELDYSVTFPASGITLAGKLVRRSAIGEHRYKSFLHDGRPLDSAELARWIAQEMAAEAPSLDRRLQERFLQQVAGSRQTLALFMSQPESALPDGYLTSEQSLLHGHPFHPFPKSVLGFSEADVRRYSPELKASFRLCYMAVRSDKFEEEWIGGKPRIADPLQAVEQASLELGASASLYRLLPVHPWQYEHVLSLEETGEYVRERQIVPLGPCGPLCHPTSSVRTVYVPEMRCNIKLALDVQITNMKRVNTREQMRRTMDAASYLLQSGCFEQEPHTQVAYEEGIAACRMPREELTALLAVAYRPIEFDPSCTFVMSSLIETKAGDDKPLLASLIDSGQAEAWFRRYLDLSLLPIVRAAEEKGIHFEAHLQNTLLSIRDGMPRSFVIRDLEGVSVDRGLAAPGAQGPLFYETKDAWARTSYYFIVNHLGSFIHALSASTCSNEKSFWAIVRDVLERELERKGGELPFVRHLLTADTFLAKRNMASCLAGTSETPAYVPVDNLMRRIRSVADAADKQLV